MPVRVPDPALGHIAVSRARYVMAMAVVRTRMVAMVVVAMVAVPHMRRSRTIVLVPMVAMPMIVAVRMRLGGRDKTEHRAGGQRSECDQQLASHVFLLMRCPAWRRVEHGSTVAIWNGPGRMQL
ncbi:hypothetical protein B551_0209810 [Cupriavidus sp. HPC(L)]|nr:hypothetical protein B551_0209810 [Cupriavidus sp. HPC(L)]